MAAGKGLGAVRYKGKGGVKEEAERKDKESRHSHTKISPLTITNPSFRLALVILCPRRARKFRNKRRVEGEV